MATQEECQNGFGEIKNRKLWCELLPGIEEFLTHTLSSETLSSFAEERRQFFIECLDIVKLPPTVPPREGHKVSPDLLKATEELNGIPVEQITPDFAATQREISRSLADPVTNPYQDDSTENEDDSSSEKGIKVYDDIDPTDSLKEDEATKPQGSEGDDNDDENDLYEIPVARQQLSSEEKSVSCNAETHSVATIGSVEDFSDDALDSGAPPLPLSPPPLPPRKDTKFSEFGSRNSLNSEEKPPELPFRPPLAKRNELYATHSEKSDRSGDRSDPDMSADGDGDSTSYESFDESVDAQDLEFRVKNNIKLPTKPKKKSDLRKNKKLSKSRSSSQWEISVPFRKLENMSLSGELYHKGKLSWNRRIVAISNSCLAMYKPDKDARPSLVISLSGYEASVLERDGKKGFEVKMAHPTQDSHTFSVDFRDWAYLWRDHINGVSKGQPLAKYETHLARSFPGNSDYGTHMGSRNDLTSSNSNLSTGSEGTSEENGKPRLRGNKVMRMGSFAFRATQFFENIGKKSSKPRKSTSNVTSISSGDYSDLQSGIVEESSISSSTSLGNHSPSALTPTSLLSLPNVFSDSSSAPSTPLDHRTSMSWTGMEEKSEECLPNIDHKGYLYIFSTFNRRKWGRRWCLVKENMFECYRTEQSRQCELNFSLRPCVIRRAVVETNSDLGLMILESGKEKITVEPLSKEEMSAWVQILLAETSTGDVPQGLEEFLQVKDGDSDSVMSFTVLKQWDMIPSTEMTSSHEYEDPMETTLTAKQLSTAACTHPSDSDLISENSSNAGGISGSLETPESGDSKLSDTSDSTQSFNKNKCTTDSGFYSVKGNNSDSDSGSDNNTPEVEGLDCGYAKLDSRSYFKAQHQSKTNNPSSDLTEASLQHVDINQNESALPCEGSPLDPCSCVHSSSIVHSTNNHTPNVDISIGKDLSCNSEKSGAKAKRPSFLPQSSPQNTLTSYASTSATILSPSGDEYSIVIKRSVKSKSPKPNSSTKNERNTPQNSESHNTNNEEKFNINDRLVIFKPEAPTLPSTPVQALETSIISDGKCSNPKKSPSSPHSSPEKDTKGVNADWPTSAGQQADQLNHDSVKTTIQNRKQRVHRVSPIKVTDTYPSHDSDSVSSPNFYNNSPDHSPFKGDSPISPNTEKITDLIDNPTTTTDDLKAAVERLKIKLSKLKKKRMAVHEKRQKVLSDEERLVCEKELAALEREAENTDLDIRVLQNHLDTLQGQSIEAMKAAHVRHKPGARKKKSKRKT